MPMQRENLIIVHSFPGNRFMFRGLIEYLNDFFEVYFIDLPGFTKAVPAMAEISFDGYVDFVARKIEELGLDSYWLGGVSFGFFIISHLPPDSSCRGVVAMAPYVGPGSLRMSFLKKTFYRAFFKSINRFELWPSLWANGLAQKYLPRLRNYSSDCIDNLVHQIDGRTFCTTAALILDNERECSFKAVPHILAANENDRTIDYDYMFKTFIKSVERLLMVNTTIDHSPQQPTKAYFKARLPEAVIEKIIDFMSTAIIQDHLSGRSAPPVAPTEQVYYQPSFVADCRVVQCS